MGEVRVQKLMNGHMLSIPMRSLGLHPLFNP